MRITHFSYRIRSYSLLYSRADSEKCESLSNSHVFTVLYISNCVFVDTSFHLLFACCKLMNTGEWLEFLLTYFQELLMIFSFFILLKIWSINVQLFLFIFVGDVILGNSSFVIMVSKYSWHLSLFVDSSRL